MNKHKKWQFAWLSCSSNFAVCEHWRVWSWSVYVCGGWMVQHFPQITFPHPNVIGYICLSIWAFNSIIGRRQGSLLPYGGYVVGRIDGFSRAGSMGSPSSLALGFRLIMGIRVQGCWNCIYQRIVSLMAQSRDTVIQSRGYSYSHQS